jgi:hypothetical protein
MIKSFIACLLTELQYEAGKQMEKLNSTAEDVRLRMKIVEHCAVFMALPFI